MTPLMVSLLASGTHITIKGLPMFVSIVETVIVPVAFGFLLNYLFGKKKLPKLKYINLLWLLISG